MTGGRAAGPPRWQDFLTSGDPGAVDAIYRRFLDDPHSVPRDVASAFARWLDEESGGSAAAADAWRSWGHLRAKLDPLALAPPAATPSLPHHPLEAAYGGSIGWQFMHLADIERRNWLSRRAEARQSPPAAAVRTWILQTLTAAEAFERALQRRFPAFKRFSLEGAESFLVASEAVIAAAVGVGVRKVVIGGMHRGRLNLLAQLMGKPLLELLSEIKGFGPTCPPPGFSGDVPYHNGYVGKRDFGGETVALSMLPHPSHLSVVAAVALGKARGEQQQAGSGGPANVLPLMMHTDAAFSGQGIVSEMLQLGKLVHFTTGGAIHLVADNHLGFTTTPVEGRSGAHSTDIATAAGIPVIHVNADDPDAVVGVATVAAEYRARFSSDIVVNIHCYRRHGHNELDEPRFTQPEVYAAVDMRPGVAELYGETLVRAGHDISSISSVRDEMDAEVSRAARKADESHVTLPGAFGGAWRGLQAGSEAAMTAFVDTGVDADRLRVAGRGLTRVPEGFRLHQKVEKFLHARRETLDTGSGITWATAEALALATLSAEGHPIRLCGQDTPRGAFSQRHLILHDQQGDARHCIAGHGSDGASVEIFSTPLSEYAVVAFEYGVSLADPARLVAWEAQFGDFMNLAQGVFDQLIIAAEARWQLSSGLVLLLPHGLDGGGPDHSTGRPERLLSAAAGANIQVVNASTPAQYFHLLRRQVKRPFRKPLAVLTPKAMLRHPNCVSEIAEFEPGTGFRCVLTEPGGNAARVVLCSGKIAFEIAAERTSRGLTDIAIIRIEQLHPLDHAGIADALEPYPHAELIWCEEDHENTGVFGSLRTQLEKISGRPIRRIGRGAAAAAATGIHAWHDDEHAALLNAVFDGVPVAAKNENATVPE